MLKMTVPASSANLGAGFDSLGLALTLYNRVWMEEADGCRIESADGVAIPTDESNMIYQTAKGLYERCGRPFHGLHIRQENNIPMTRGLGSSSACLVAGLLGANTLLGCPLSEEDLADLAAELEGHPDNTAPALLGGLVTAVMEGGRVYTVSVPVSENIRFAVFIPDFELKTEVARAALPEQVSRADAVYNLSRAALMTASLCKGDFSHLRVAVPGSFAPAVSLPDDSRGGAGVLHRLRARCPCGRDQRCGTVDPGGHRQCRRRLCRKSRFPATRSGAYRLAGAAVQL